MIKRTISLFSFLVSSLGFSMLPAEAQSCPRVNNPQSTAYIRREQEKRCEGIQANDISGDFSLISYRHNAPVNRYELRVKAELEQDNAPPEPVSINIAFEHDPQWLK